MVGCVVAGESEAILFRRREQRIEVSNAMNENKGLLIAGLNMVMRNKRYIFWFWLLNLTLGEFGVSAFRRSTHAVLDHSLHSAALVHGFDLSVLLELLARPQFGVNSLKGFLAHPATSATLPASAPALYFAFLFLVLTVLVLPGVLSGYVSRYRLRREDFFRACGRNLWQMVRLVIVAGILMTLVSRLLFRFHSVLERQSMESTNEMLLPVVQGLGLVVIFLLLAGLRIAFDLAEADVVLSDQGAVRRSISAGFRHAAQSLGKLIACYIATTFVAGVVMLLGLSAWVKLVAPENVWAAFAVSQITLLFLLVPRFWQRGVAVAYWQQRMMALPIPITPGPARVTLSGMSEGSAIGEG
jgi:hypothetical protein